MSPTISANTAEAVELEMDLEVKSEPESEDDTMNSSISVTSSVEEVMKPEHFQSDEEELENEPLVRSLETRLHIKNRLFTCRPNCHKLTCHFLSFFISFEL